MIRKSCLDVSMIYSGLEKITDLIYFPTYLVELDYIGMSDDLEDVDFTSDSLHVRLVLDLVLLKYFDSYLFTSDEVSSETNLSEGALTQRST